MSDDKVSSWVGLQRAVWDCDEGLRAQLITFETPAGDVIASWPVDLEKLPEVINQTVEMHAAELPKGVHRFRLVSYADRGRKTQLTELPQTLRGRSQDASQANADALALQRATAMAVNNCENALAISTRVNERLEERLNEMTENFRLAFDKLTESNAENFDQKLRFAEFEAKQRRADQMMESLLTCLTPVITIAAEKFGPKLLNMDPAELHKILETKPPAAPAAPGLPDGTQGTNAANSTEPDSAPSAVVHEPGQRGIPLNGETRRAGNRKPTASQRSRAPKGPHPNKRGKRR